MVQPAGSCHCVSPHHGTHLERARAHGGDARARNASLITALGKLDELSTPGGGSETVCRFGEDGRFVPRPGSVSDVGWPCRALPLTLVGRAVPCRAVRAVSCRVVPSRAEPSRAEPSRAEPSGAVSVCLFYAS